jgi:hypothetical protein
VQIEGVYRENIAIENDEIASLARLDTAGGALLLQPRPPSQPPPFRAPSTRCLTQIASFVHPLTPGPCEADEFAGDQIQHLRNARPSAHETAGLS